MAQLFLDQEIPLIPSVEEFKKTLLEKKQQQQRIVALFTYGPELYALVSDDPLAKCSLVKTPKPKNFDTFTGDFPELHLCEREIFEEEGILPAGHPDLRPVRKLHQNYFHIKSEQMHEVGVGPVHAGIIEPGHFRFQCHGENVFHLEISLGYQHRGVKKLLLGSPSSRSLSLVETVAGDTTIGHTWAYCDNIETLAGVTVGMRELTLRALMLELERLANHVGDLGALANDVGYLPTSSFCGRIRGDYLNLSLLLSGSRFGRGFLSLGGVRFDVNPKMAKEVSERLESIYRDTLGAMDLLWDTSSVIARFEHTGTLSHELALRYGIVGVAARASGVALDARSAYLKHQLPEYHVFIPAVLKSGDVLARAYVRKMEIDQSVVMIQQMLGRLSALAPLKDTSVEKKERVQLRPNAFSISFIEGWRGEICHIARSDEDGKICSYHLFDPSFHNWTGLELALKNQEISDFPLCNKSFNLSYCGFDL